jgi:hypothetical protein
LRQPTPTEAKEMLTYISTRPDYDLWIKIISAIGNTFDHNTALDILLSHFKDEKPNEHATKLKNCLKNVSLATLIYYAKQNGYKTTFSINQDESKTYARPIQDKSKVYASTNQDKSSHNSYLNHTKIIAFTDADKSFYYRFTDNIEERLAIMQYDGNISRIDAERIILTESPEIPRERAYRVAVNNKVKDKVKDFKILNANFENQILTASEIANHIGQGFSIICGEMKTNDSGKIQRKNKNWVCSELIALDIDTGFTIDDVFNLPQTKYALLIYTTPSHTTEHHRFRILFDLPYVEYNQERYTEILRYFIQTFKADRQCSNISRNFFGNSNAKIYILRTSQISQYKNGYLLND